MTKKIILGLIAGSAFVVLVAQYSLAAPLGEDKVVYEYSQVENEQLQTIKEWVKEEKELTRMVEIGKEKERLAKVEAERLAKKKAEEEEAARLAAEKETARIAEEARLAEEAEIARIEEERLAEVEEEIAYQAVQETQVIQEEVAYSDTPEAEVYEAPVQVAARARTDGFNFNGYHYDIASFSGSGLVPQWTPYSYQWTSKPNHYLVEMMSDAGSAISSLGMGRVVVLNGQSYVATNIISGLENDLYASDLVFDSYSSINASDLVFDSYSSITIQTCDPAIGRNGQNLLTLWFLDAI